MVTNLKNLKNEIDSRLAGGGLTSLDCCQLQNAETILDNNIVYSVANIASLPNPLLNEGRFVYVDDIKEYRFSNGSGWEDNVCSVVASQNQLWAWGRNFCGVLGDGTTLFRCSPVREFCYATNWCQVSIVSSPTVVTTLAIKTSGELWSWGRGVYGVLGDGTTLPRCSPVREICSATNWCQASAGGAFSTAIKTSGELWSWGNGSGGRLGDGTSTSRCSPVREFCSATDWCQVSAGVLNGFGSAAIKTSGELWAWGCNFCGRLGDGTTVTRCSPVREFCSATDWCQVGAGSCHKIALKTSGELWGWGRSAYGLLGDGTTVTRCSPVREFCSATDWCQVSAGDRHSAAIKTSGELWAWGQGTCGRLGDGTLTQKCSPVREILSGTDWCQVSAGNYDTGAIKTSGQLWGWGSNNCGQLGDGTTTARCYPVRESGFFTDWCQVAAGSHTVAIRLNCTGFLE